jgi:hypothetical protein
VVRSHRYDYQLSLGILPHAVLYENYHDPVRSYSVVTIKSFAASPRGGVGFNAVAGIADLGNEGWGMFYPGSLTAARGLLYEVIIHKFEAMLRFCTSLLNLNKETLTC